MRKELIVLLVLLSVSLAIGCTGNQSEAPNATVTPVSAVTPGTTASETITVSAAASLTNAFTDIAAQFEKENPGTNVSLNFGSSGSLRTQIEGGAPVDVFASADQNQMNILSNESLILNDSRKNFANNSLVLIVPATSTLNITGLKDLADPKVQKIGIGNPDTVPVGNYTKTALNEAGLWSQLENKTVPGEDVRQVLTYVERGEVDAGFIYSTDAKIADPGTIKVVTNVSVSTPITYPIAVVSASNNKETAQKFLEFVSSPEGQEILNKYGFAQ
ncbi:MAG TPA: molybdate ABC transporter substrate-binding protein [Methanosarcina sp.]|nr:molybdate ABC transporter substrate-binding protein [Methanosarcina sp.]